MQASSCYRPALVHGKINYLSTDRLVMNFKHSGHLGDIIYALPVMREMSRHQGHDTFSIYIPRNKPAHHVQGLRHIGGNIMFTQPMFDFVYPLLRIQPYIHDVHFITEANIPSDAVSFDGIRDGSINTSAGNISDYYSKYFGVPKTGNDPWLIGRLDQHDKGIVIGRSQRYINDAIDYTLLNQTGIPLSFIGTDKEYRHFQARYPASRAQRILINNALDVLNIIRAADLYIGNQSFFFALAEAMQCSRLLEVYEPVPNVIPQGGICGQFLSSAGLISNLNSMLHLNFPLPEKILPRYVLCTDTDDFVGAQAESGPEPEKKPDVAIWLPESRWSTMEKNWADETLSDWRDENWHLPRFALAILPAKDRQRQQSTDSLNAQWLCGESIEIQADQNEDSLLQTVNRTLLESDADWFAVMDAGDELSPDALFRVAHAIHGHPEWQIIYSDEDSLSANGEYSNPHCKPDFNLDYLRSMPYIGRLLMVRRELFTELNGFDPTMHGGAEEYDLVLRAWEYLQNTPAKESAIGHIADVLYHRLQGHTYSKQPFSVVWSKLQETLQRHLSRQHIDAQVQPGPFPAALRVRYPLMTTPLVSIIIPTRNQLDFLHRCIESIISKTRYPAYEILVVDNGSDDVNARRYLDAIREQNNNAGQIRVVDYPEPFNFSAMNNRAVQQARGDYVLMLNNDTAVLHDDWLDEMMSHALRPEVGIVGAKLLYPDGRIQHAGVILGMKGVAEHPFIGHNADERGYFGRLQLTQDFSAVTGACLLLSKKLYQSVGGLDERDLQVSYSDIDLCLKVGKTGQKIVWTPWSILLHEGSASQKSATEKKDDTEKVQRFSAERDIFSQRWLNDLAVDPAYNRQLSLLSTDFLIDNLPPLTWNPDWRPRPRILAYSADRTGCGEYRIIAPMRALNRAGLVQGWETMRLIDVVEMQRMQPDSLVMQRQTEWQQIEMIERHVKANRTFLIYEIDDLITNLPIKSVHKKQIHKDIIKRMRKAVSLCHRLVVATEPLAAAYAGFTDEVRVLPNFLEAARWGNLQPVHVEHVRPRVGWAGGLSHAGDLELIIDVVRETAQEIDWVFFGLCPDAIKPLVKEYHAGVVLDNYPAILAKLDLDLAIAPLEINAFNEAKSHLRLLEYGILGYPVICTDIFPYQGSFPVTRVDNRFRDWVRAIRDALADRDALRQQGETLRQHVLANWMMEDHLEQYLDAWTPGDCRT